MAEPTPDRAIVLWRPDPEAAAAKEKLTAARAAEGDARLALAEAKRKHAEMLRTGTELVLSQLEKYLRLSQHPDFQNAIGPLDPGTILKIMEFVSKNYRLDTGQATEHVAHVIGPSVDFSKFTQEERDQWRALALKGGGNGE